MSFYSEVEMIMVTFPARGIAMNANAGKGELGFNASWHRCKNCRKKFAAYKEHQYKIYTGKARTEHWFCSDRCLRAYEKRREEKCDAIIKKCTEKLEYLEGQYKLPQELRDPTIKDIYNRITNVEVKLNSAIRKKAGIW